MFRNVLDPNFHLQLSPSQTQTRMLSPTFSSFDAVDQLFQQTNSVSSLSESSAQRSDYRFQEDFNFLNEESSRRVETPFTRPDANQSSHDLAQEQEAQTQQAPQNTANHFNDQQVTLATEEQQLRVLQPLLVKLRYNYPHLQGSEVLTLVTTVWNRYQQEMQEADIATLFSSFQFKPTTLIFCCLNQFNAKNAFRNGIKIQKKVAACQLENDISVEVAELRINNENYYFFWFAQLRSSTKCYLKIISLWLNHSAALANQRQQASSSSSDHRQLMHLPVSLTNNTSTFFRNSSEQVNSSVNEARINRLTSSSSSFKHP